VDLVMPEMLTQNPLWITNNQHTIVIHFHHCIMASTHRDFFQEQSDGGLIHRPKIMGKLSLPIKK
jgi:hypothetical protein